MHKAAGSFGGFVCIMSFEGHFFPTEESKDVGVNMGLTSPQVTRGLPLPGHHGACERKEPGGS